MQAVSREYVNRNVSVEKLADDIEEHVQNDGYKTQRADTEKGHMIQAQKVGVLRELLADDRALVILVTGEPSKLKVAVDVGRWLQNLTVNVV